MLLAIESGHKTCPKIRFECSRTSVGASQIDRQSSLPFISLFKGVHFYFVVCSLVRESVVAGLVRPCRI